MSPSSATVGTEFLHFLNLFKVMYIGSFIPYLDHLDIMVLVDPTEATCLFIIHSQSSFVKLFLQIILVSKTFNLAMKRIYFDNASEFTVQNFIEYYMSIGATI